MDEARTLFLSLPLAAQAYLRAASQMDPFNLHKLTRAAYPYVQTLADAQGIAEFLANEPVSNLEARERVQLQSSISIRPGVVISAS